MPLPLLPLVPLLTGLLCWPLRSRRAFERLNLLGAGVLCALAARLIHEVLTTGPIEIWGGFLRADALSALVIGLTAWVGLLVAIYAVGYLRHDEAAGVVTLRQLRLYYTLTPLLTFAMIMVPLANNLGIMWVAIEGTTLASVLLVMFYNRKTSLEAAWKYIIIGSIGIALALFGTILTYYSAVDVLGGESKGGLNWSVLATLADRFDPQAMRLAFIMILIGYGTKAGLAPMHTWKPDAYGEAPVPSAALMGAALINCAIYGLMRFQVLATRCLGPEFSGTLLVLFGVASILVAAPFVLVQRNFRRLLAYSSIDHAGIMVAALGFGGRLGVLGALLHMLYHAAAKPLMFFGTGNLQQHYDTSLLRRVRGAFHTARWTAGLLFMAALAVTGTPPFTLFQSEFIALTGALANGYLLAAGLFVLGIVTVFSGFLWHMVRLTLGPARGNAARRTECPWKLGAMLLAAVPVLLFVVLLPKPLGELIEKAALILNPGSP